MLWNFSSHSSFTRSRGLKKKGGGTSMVNKQKKLQKKHSNARKNIWHVIVPSVQLKEASMKHDPLVTNHGVVTMPTCFLPWLNIYCFCLHHCGHYLQGTSWLECCIKSRSNARSRKQWHQSSASAPSISVLTFFNELKDHGFSLLVVASTENCDDSWKLCIRPNNRYTNNIDASMMPFNACCIVGTVDSC